jgi:hypothetical protein
MLTWDKVPVVEFGKSILSVFNRRCLLCTLIPLQEKLLKTHTYDMICL